MLIEDTSRLYSPKMEYYRQTYKHSKRWNGVDSIDGKHIVVYCEQGLGDSIQFLRYVPILKEYSCTVSLHIFPELHTICRHVEGVDHVLDRHDPDLPEHDFHVPSLSLPFVLNRMEAPGSYIHITEQEDLSEYQENLKVGIAWEGSPGHSNNQERSCPLKYFRNIHDLPNVQLFSLQKQIHLPNLVEGAENMNLLGADLNDFYDTAKLVNAMDVIVTVDTSILHLAGALETQKPIFALMSYREDPRWAISPWYKNITFLKQTAPGNWWSVFTQLERVMQNLIF